MNSINLVNIGFGSIAMANRVIAIISPESAPIKRSIQDARERGILIDATFGRRTRAVIITDSGQVLLSSLQPETIANRIRLANTDSEKIAIPDVSQGNEAAWGDGADTNGKEGSYTNG